MDDQVRHIGAHGVSRRRLLHSSAVGVVGLLVSPSLALANTEKTRTLAFHNLHTGESLKAAFWENGAPVKTGLQEINEILRDFRTGEVIDMDIALMHLLHKLRTKVHSRQSFNVISGYRSPATNAKLREKSNGVAKKSFHMRGMAIDISLQGCDLHELRDAARELHLGGVGFYPKSGFIHVDTGRPRYWS
ncbi:MAG: DUF882 domain-containing protein [Alphaproteobacteria bacterium]